jgi:two-component system response regulator RegA
MNTHHLLIVEDDATFGALLKLKFEAKNWTVSLAKTLDEAQHTCTTHPPFSHCILDLNVANHSSLRLIPPLLSQNPTCKIVILTGFASIDTSIQAIKLGAKYLLSKPCSLSDIIAAFDHTPDAQNVRLDPLAQKSIDTIEWETIQKALLENEFNISKTAQYLGMHRRTLQRKLKKKP